MTSRSLILAAFFIGVATVASAQTPGAPSNLTATVELSGNVTLQWTAPAGGGVPTGYLVQAGTTSGASDALNQQIGNVTTHQIVAGSLQPGIYFVRVRALNGSGISGPSNEVTAGIACSPPDQAPTSLAWRASATGAQLTWVGITGGAQYRVEVGTSSGSSNITNATTASGSNRNVLGVVLPGAGTYYARVKAVRTCGTSPTLYDGPASAEVTILAAPITPSTTVVINEFNTFVELKNVTTAVLDVSGWRIHASSGASQLVARLATIPAGTSIAPGCTYLLAAAGDTVLGAIVPDRTLSDAITEGVAVVRADSMVVDAAGRLSNFDPAGPNTPYIEAQGLPRRADSTSIQSFARAGDQDTNNNVADFVPLATANPQNAATCAANQPPSPPQNLTVTITGSTVALAWTAPTSGAPVTTYRLEVGTAPGTSNAGIFNLPGSLTSVAFAGVTNATFYVRIRAVTSAGVSAASNEVPVVVCAIGCNVPPGAVTQLAFQLTGRNVTLTWRAPSTGSAPTGYRMEAGTQSGLTNIGLFPTGSTAASVTVANVPPGTYFVRVRAMVGATLGPPSNEVMIVVP